MTGGILTITKTDSDYTRLFVRDADNDKAQIRVKRDDQLKKIKQAFKDGKKISIWWQSQKAYATWGAEKCELLKISNSSSWNCS